MKKAIIILFILFGGVFSSFFGCGEGAQYYILKDLSFRFFPSPVLINNYKAITADTLRIEVGFLPEYVVDASSKSWTFEEKALAWQFFYGQLGFKDKLQDIIITTNTAIGPVLPGGDISATMQYDYFPSKDSLIGHLNNGGLESHANVLDYMLYIPGPGVDSLVAFTFEFLFENSTFVKTTDTIIWLGE